MFANRYIGGVKITSVAIYIVVVLVIIAYGCYLRAFHKRDFLEPVLFTHPVLQQINGWSISHLLFFGLLGALFPNRHLQFLTVGIAWEGIESALGQNRLEISGRRVQLIGAQDENGQVIDEPAGADEYWYGKESDIVMDMVGYCLGSAAVNAAGWTDAT